ncbi:MAG: DEAD/DEAH box helicase [Proteobacteria bacterium]|nr:MAG: DEAD/DEAH box helicase [Pseudomonadota bacterium]
MQSFSELPLSPAVLRAVQEIGYTTPSPIQAEALPVLLATDTDFLGLAGTGTGKTATFSIPLLEKLDPSLKAVQALILCPTRELAVQVAGQVDLLGKYKGIKSVTIYGGANYGDQIAGLRRGAQVVVGTPGRVIDHLEKGTLKLDQLKVLVLDEADEMFSMGFKEELDAVIAAMPKEGANTWLFSATMSSEVRRVVDRNLHDPKIVQVNRKEMLSSGVEQLFYKVQEYEKPQVIASLIDAAEDFYGVIFCQTKALVQDLSVFLTDRGYKVDSLHGDKDQNSREKTMQAFRDRKLQVLVCTDVAARGLDVKDITHVINYSLPRELDSYVHRIGRTARSGKTGYAMNLVTFSHRHLLTRLEQFTKVQMKEAFVPSAREIGAKKVAKILPALTEQQFGERVLEVMGEDFKAALAEMTAEDVASKFIAMMMPDVFGLPASRKTKKAERTGAPARSSDMAEERGQSYERRAPISAPRPYAARPAAVPAPPMTAAAPASFASEAPAAVASAPISAPAQNVVENEVENEFELDIASMLNEEPVFGVNIQEKPAERAPDRFADRPPRRFDGNGDSRPRSAGSFDRGGDSRPRTGGFERGGGFSRGGDSRRSEVRCRWPSCWRSNFKRIIHLEAYISEHRRIKASEETPGLFHFCGRPIYLRTRRRRMGPRKAEGLTGFPP